MSSKKNRNNSVKKYRKFVDVFNKQNVDKLSQHDCFDHTIKIKKKILNLFTICR